jgi:hypothetical protein
MGRRFWSRGSRQCQQAHHLNTLHKLDVRQLQRYGLLDGGAMPTLGSVADASIS